MENRCVVGSKFQKLLFQTATIQLRFSLHGRGNEFIVKHHDPFGALYRETGMDVLTQTSSLNRWTGPYINESIHPSIPPSAPTRPKQLSLNASPPSASAANDELGRQNSDTL